MTFEQLRIFLKVAEHEHVTRAAELLHLTQSAVSGAIQTLENNHQVKLFDRVGRGIRLTDEGRLLQEKAMSIIAAVQDAEATLNDICGLRTGELRLHASQTISSHWLPRHLMRFNSQHPGITITQKVANTEQCLDAVRNGECDLAYVEGAIDGLLTAVDHERIEQRVVAEDQLLLVSSPMHPWALHQPEAIETHLTEKPWVMRERGSGTRSSFEAALRERGVDPDELPVAMEFTTNEAVCTAIQNSAAIGAVSKLVAAPLIESGRMVRLPFPPALRPFRQLRMSERHFSRAARAFCALLEPPTIPGIDPQT